MVKVYELNRCKTSKTLLKLMLSGLLDIIGCLFGKPLDLLLGIDCQ